MKIISETVLINKNGNQPIINTAMQEIRESILQMENPKGSGEFRLFRGKNMNGVKPIKETFMKYLTMRDWQAEYRIDVGVSLTRPGPIDAVKFFNNDIFAVEWETGNIASSHRALNKITTGILNQRLIGGVLILPSREMYTHLTDRVGNYRELSPYFDVWRKASYPVDQGFLAVIEIEHDSLSDDKSLQIKKGTDGRALI
ncbi:hypothetical protein M3579_12870 [Bacillus pumilus]|uniref:restriction endonuclease n=1 Tax=Bacillus TaxID=1386 RepID=UPI0015BE3376|nr:MULTISPECIES: restriction endonuclease [Bacillus]MCM3036858.1 hypothetical protein [Bacillus pumilus]